MMTYPVAVLTGDNHLRPYTWARHPTLAEDAYVSLSQIVDYCCANSLPLLQLGDLFQAARPDARSVQVLFQQLDRLQAAGQDFWYIAGNHDRDPPNPPWATLHPHTKTCEGAFGYAELATWPGQKIGLIPYAPVAQLPQIQQQCGETNLWLTHQAWVEVQGVGASATFANFPHGGTVLTGDYHVTGQYRGVAANGDGIIAYSPGSTAMQALNEDPRKYFGVLYADATVQWVLLQTRDYYRYTCLTQQELDRAVESLSTLSLREGLPAEISKPVAVVTFNATLPEAESRLQAAVGDRYHLFPVPTRASDLIAEMPAAEEPERTSDVLLRESIHTLVGEAEARSLAMRLLDAASPKAEVVAAYEEYTAAAGRTTYAV